MLSDLQMCRLNLFHFTCLHLILKMKWKDAKYKSHWNIFIFCDQWKMMSDLNKSYGKIPDFVSFPLFRFIAVIKLTNIDSESHWNILIFFDKKRYGVRFENVPLGNILFCFIIIVWVHFSHKTEKYRFWKSLKYFNLFW